MMLRSCQKEPPDKRLELPLDSAARRVLAAGAAQEFCILCRTREAVVLQGAAAAMMYLYAQGFVTGKVQVQRRLIKFQRPHCISRIYFNGSETWRPPA